MTTEIEKTFFDTFGVEPRYKCADGALEPCNEQCNECGYYELRYPQISDRILLELLVIMTRYTDIIDGFDNVQELKEFVLKDLIYSLTQPECNIVKHQVQALFKEG